MAKPQEPWQILVVGGGYVGMNTALHLQRRLRLRRGEATITVVDPQSYMTYQPFLPEAAAGSLEPRHVVVPLRKVLKRCRVITGTVGALDHDRRRARIEPAEGDPFEMSYDHVVIAPGSVPRILPIPGLAEAGIGFKTVAEAVYLRNYVLSRLDAAASNIDPELRRRALTFVFVGGGYAGIEALGELEDMARAACRYYRGIIPQDMRWVLVEASDRILPEVSQRLGRYTVDRLRARGIDVRLSTRLESCTDTHIVLSDGERFDAETVVWTAGGKPNPILAEYGVPLDDRGRVRSTVQLRVQGMRNVWSAGDCAAVPDVTQGEGAFCGPSAQHAVRQSRVLAHNIVRVLRGHEPKGYRHAYAGSVASLGLHKGVAEVYGVRLHGLPAWFMHRSYHLMWVPTVNRKVRVLSDWTLALFFRREAVNLGQFADPRASFRAAAGGAREPARAETVAPVATPESSSAPPDGPDPRPAAKRASSARKAVPAKRAAKKELPAKRAAAKATSGKAPAKRPSKAARKAVAGDEARSTPGSGAQDGQD
ncbi:MAG TPA: FAD-dependent oxidoreductase [Mycobacteriales bacterium]|jgi:NADH dehydrogenase|nr:FAD-dependent oxidoreductase [Mycobacteriales bacterium]